MNILCIVGQLWPKPSNNTMLIGKLLGYFHRDHEVRVLSLSSLLGLELSKEFRGETIYCMNRGVNLSRQKRLFRSICARLIDPNGNSDYLCVQQLTARLKEIHREYPFDALIACSEPFPAAAVLPCFPKTKSALYLMDPPECVCNNLGTTYRNKKIWSILKSANSVVTTPFIHSALFAQKPNLINRVCFTEVGFPMVTKTFVCSNCTSQQDRIALLFTGWMCSEIRSPKYFLDILSRLDERFVVTFMGRECEKLTERFDIQTKAELITLPQQPYETALQAMADADVMINIGNSVPVHMPSKTLEYINTGKPFVNFYKMDDCPTLYYTKRYPLCLNLSEQDPDLDAAAARFTDFCLSNKGKTVDRTYIESEYADCTPEYIANQILRALESE